MSLSKQSRCFALALAALLPVKAGAETVQYPLIIENCGHQVTFSSAPERAFALGQNSAELLLLLGLEDKLAASAFWPTDVLPELRAANEKVDLLTIEMPTVEGVLGKNPDFVVAALPILMGPNSKVSKREDFESLGIPTYLSPSVCDTRIDTGDAHGSREQLWNMQLLFKEIQDLAQIFNVVERGEQLIQDLTRREATLKDKFKTDSEQSFLFWFSSPSADADAYLGGGLGPSAYIADLLGGRNAIKTAADWPTVSWEGIIAANPTVIVVAELDRNRWELDRASHKIDYLKSDPAVKLMDAVVHDRLLVMNGAAMNPSIRTIYGAEQLARQLEQMEGRP